MAHTYQYRQSLIVAWQLFIKKKDSKSTPKAGQVVHEMLVD